MAKYTAPLTDKQLEMLKPLEKRFNEIVRKQEKNQKRLAFESALGFDENQKIQKEQKELDEERIELSARITKIYNAHSEMIQHMMAAMNEVKQVDAYIEKYGFEGVYKQ